MTHVPPGPDAPGANDTTDAKDPPARGGRQALVWSIKILVSSGLLYVLLSRVDLSRLWAIARTASVAWLVVALALYFVMVFISAWRWGVLLHVQKVAVGLGPLLRSYLVATFFNNFLPSNIGGDVIRVRDTARAAGSKTRAAAVVLVDRGIGLLALVLIAAVGASMATTSSPVIAAFGPGLLWLAFGIGTLAGGLVLLRPSAVGRVLTPLKALHQEWVEEWISRLMSALARFRESPSALALGFAGGIVVQVVLVLFYAAIAQAILVPIPIAHLAVLIPLSFIVQMAPVSVNGLGVREATFSFYFARLGLPLESALALSFLGAALVMLFSISGGVANLTRGQRPADSGQRTIS